MAATQKDRRLRLWLVLASAVLINIICSRLYFRIDMTEEDRFSLSQATSKLASKIDDNLHITVYLEGDLPPGFRKLQSATRDLLNSIRRESGGKVDFEFVNPSELTDSKGENALFQQFMTKGLLPTDLQVKSDGGLERKIIWPGALINFRGKEYAVNFLASNSPGEDPLASINNSEEMLEYAFANGIRKAMAKTNPKILFVEGNRELRRRQVLDFVQSLSEFYEVQAYTLSKPEPIPANVKVLVIAKPDSTFTEWQRFKLDNFVMQGGRILWLIDQVAADMDSMQGQLAFMGFPRNLYIDDMLFRYGVRLNYNLVQDIRCTPIPIVVGQVGNRPQTELMPWYYYPLITPNGQHPISKNLDPVQMKFAGTIDLIDNQVEKHVLLTTSRYTKVVPAPLRVNLGIIKEKPDPRQFNKPNQPVAVLLEGKFPSMFKNRMMGSFAEKVLDSLNIKVVDESVPTRMIVVSDGDIIANAVNKQGEIGPLGYDRYTRQLYGNKSFLLNCIDYLADDSDFMQIRAKEITLRLLNRQKVAKQKTMWQALNVGLPLVLLSAYGWYHRRRRIRKYTK